MEKNVGRFRDLVRRRAVRCREDTAGRYLQRKEAPISAEPQGPRAESQGVTPEVPLCCVRRKSSKRKGVVMPGSQSLRL